MKTIREEVKRVEVITKYEAVDGTIFNSDAECMSYEETAGCVIRARFANSLGVKLDNDGFPVAKLCIDAFPMGCNCQEDTVAGVIPKSKEDVDAINLYLKHQYSDINFNQLLTYDAIGKRVLIVTEGYDAEYVSIITEDEYIRHSKQAFDWVFSGKPECSSCKYFIKGDTDSNNKCGNPKTYLCRINQDITSTNKASAWCYEPKTTLTLAQQRCQDCACLVLDDDGNWCCDEEDGAEIEDITCPEGLGRLSCYTEKEDK